uniref:Uncharacterized protein n=1 Tax=Oryza punctata TaxID=4537 RepID=A0A0E0MKR8_ORYPU
MPFGLEQRGWTCHSTADPTEDAIFPEPAGVAHGDAQHGGLPTVMGTMDRRLAEIFVSPQRLGSGDAAIPIRLRGAVMTAMVTGVGGGGLYGGDLDRCTGGVEAENRQGREDPKGRSIPGVRHAEEL